MRGENRLDGVSVMARAELGLLALIGAFDMARYAVAWHRARRLAGHTA